VCFKREQEEDLKIKLPVRLVNREQDSLSTATRRTRH